MNLMMWGVYSSSKSNLMRGIRGGSILYCVSAPRHWPFSWLMSWSIETDLLTSHIVTFQSDVCISLAGYNCKLKLMYRIRGLNLDVFHIVSLLISFLIRDPSPHLVGWWSSMSSLLVFVTYKKPLLFHGNMLCSYGFSLPLLYDVLLKTVKIYQLRNHGISCWRKFYMTLTCYETSAKVLNIVNIFYSEWGSSFHIQFPNLQ